MVRVLLLLMLPFLAFGESVNVKAEVSRGRLYEHYSVHGMIIIEHTKDQAVEVESFTYEGKKLDVQLDKEVRVDPNAPLVISIYRFDLPEQPAGDHMLLPITVNVGGEVYTTPSVPYVVYKGGVPKNFEEPLLKLEARVVAEDPLYPGQRVQFIYRYIYRGDIRMTKEELPLLKAEGFKQIGEERIKDYDDKDKSIREITLEAEALEPGKFTFGPSVIEGQAAVPGRPAAKLHAETPSITITVSPFPEGEKPVAFKGAYGKFAIASELLSPATVRVGDRLTLAIDVVGENGQLEKVELPQIFCQPGFPGMFIQDDLPATGKIEGDRKRFTIYLRPLNDGVAEIPSVVLSYYNPATNEYEKSAAKAIPIKVLPVENVMSGTMKKLALPQKIDQKENWPELLSRVPQIEAKQTAPLTLADLEGLLFGNWYALLIFPLGVGAVAAQLYLKQRLERFREQKRPLTAEQLMERAMMSRHKPAEFFDLAARAFKMILFERGEIGSPDVPMESLPNGAVKEFLLGIQYRRYAVGTLDPEAAAQEAETLFRKIKDGNRR